VQVANPLVAAQLGSLAPNLSQLAPLSLSLCLCACLSLSVRLPGELLSLLGGGSAGRSIVLLTN